MDTATAQQLLAALLASGITLPTVPQKTGDDPTNDIAVAKDISWPDFWKKVNEIIGKDVLPPVAMQFASSLKELRDMNTWKNSEILDAYKTWTPVDKEKAKVEKEAKKAEKESKKAEKEAKEKAKADAKAEKDALKAKVDAKVEKELKAKAKVAEAQAQAQAEAKEAEEKAKAQAEEKAKAQLKEADADKKISKKVKTDVWNTFIGDGIANHKCLCCKMTTIDKANFDCGHVLSRAEGGGPEIHNLRPICSGCNNGMGTMNMIEYVKKHGYYIGGGR
jgi:hypothetical protein